MSLKQELLEEIDEILDDVRRLPFSERAEIAAKLSSPQRSSITMTRPASVSNLLQAGAPLTVQPQTSTASEVALLNAQPGRNPVERALSLLATRDASFKSLPFGEQCFRAGQFVQSLARGNASARQTPAPPPPPPRVPANTCNVADLVQAFNSSPGRNHVEKMHALLYSRDPSFQTLDLGTRCRVAGEAVRTLMSGARPRSL